jgi:NAD(P)-dependent dehydrogenase (short-subunit alcohol dehydrogenase family)
MTAQLEGAVALVTGGAAGIGKAAALAFARHGARVALCDLKS